MAYDPIRRAWLRRQVQPTGERPDPAEAFDEETGFRLVFDATCSQPDYAKLFLATGGAINTAAGAGPVDFAVTGSTAAIKVPLNSNECRLVSVDLPPSLITVDEGRLRIDSNAKLNISSSRLGASISGTLVHTHAGAGAVYLANLLRTSDTHTQVPCVYGTLASHSCTVGLSGVNILDSLGEPVDVEFVQDDEKNAILAEAETAVDRWAQSAWDMREKVVYKLSPALTKSVAKVPVGVNDKGYELVHNIVDQELPFSTKALNSLFEHTIGMELEYDDDELKQMLEATEKPGLGAAVWAQTVAAACSTAACYLVAYRADGRTVMQATGSGFVATESWLRSQPLMQGNDCDGSALAITSALQAAVTASEDDLAVYPFLRAVKNAVFPYYVYGIAVVGATSAEASSGGGDGDQVAGHAIALMVPTLSLLNGLDRAANRSVAGKPVVPTGSTASQLRDARLKAVFDEDTLATLPQDEAARLRAGDVASWVAAERLKPFAVEGTTPASPVVYIDDSTKRAMRELEAEREMKAFAAAAPNVGRGSKVLHVGGKHRSDPHKFYHDFVELSIHPHHPLYSSSELRALGSAASQLVFTRLHSKDIAEAGCSPRQLVSNDYGLLPLHAVNEIEGKVLDFAAAVSKEDVIPPRAGSMMLTPSQSRDLRRSLTALESLDAHLPKQECEGQCVAYIFAYSALVHNPHAIEHFVERAQATSAAGVVDFRKVQGLALHADGEEAGDFVVVNVVVEV